MASSADGLQYQLDTFDQWSKKWNLSVNIESYTLVELLMQKHQITWSESVMGMPRYELIRT